MTAAILFGAEDLRLAQVSIPVADTGEIIVRVGAALTCGTDLKVYRRGYHARMLKPPIPFGHEVAGYVAEVGKGVTQFVVGDRVVPLNSAPCDRCFFCLQAQHNLCENLLFNNGAYAEFLRVPGRIVEKNTFILPDDVPLEHAALTEPLACVLHGLKETGAKLGDSIIVIGAGAIGLMFMRAAQLTGLDVMAVVKREDQVKLAERFGARQVLSLEESAEAGDDNAFVESARAMTPGRRGADIVVEAVATPKTWEWAVGMVRKGGVVNFFGGPPSGTSVALDTNRLHYGEITLKASFHHTPSMCRTALALIASGRFRCADYITTHAMLSEVPETFKKMLMQSDSATKREIKTAIVPDAKNTFSEVAE